MRPLFFVIKGVNEVFPSILKRFKECLVTITHSSLISEFLVKLPVVGLIGHRHNLGVLVYFFDQMAHELLPGLSIESQSLVVGREEHDGLPNKIEANEEEDNDGKRRIGPKESFDPILQVPAENAASPFLKVFGHACEPKI